MALYILAVPSISDECGRLFSSAKVLLSDQRLRLRIDIIKSASDPGSTHLHGTLLRISASGN
jgi:hypothetical protein